MLKLSKTRYILILTLFVTCPRQSMALSYLTAAAVTVYTVAKKHVIPTWAADAGSWLLAGLGYGVPTVENSVRYAQTAADKQTLSKADVNRWAQEKGIPKVAETSSGHCRNLRCKNQASPTKRYCELCLQQLHETGYQSFAEAWRDECYQNLCPSCGHTLAEDDFLYCKDCKPANPKHEEKYQLLT